MLSACKRASCASGFDKVTFTYDGEGNRTQIVSDPAGTGGSLEPTTRDFRYQDDAIVEELLTDATHSNVVVRSYVVDESGTEVRLTVAAGEPDAGDYVPVWNGHGDAVNLSRLNADGSLTLANSYRYETWGKPTTATHNAVPDLGFRFTYVGEFDVQWDDQLGLGLVYMHARHYSPALGRFVQPDPDRSEANLYAYAANNPVTEMDPDGTCFIVCQLVIGAAIDAFVYLATTDNASLGGLASAVAGGAIESAINPLAKLSKVAKLAKAASKLLGKVPKATRKVQRIVSRVGAGTESFFNGSRASQRGQIRIGARPPKSTKELREVISSWDKGTFRSRADSIRYHHGKHGNGRSVLEYTRAARKFADENRASFKFTRPKNPTHSPSWFFRRGKQAGHYTSGGKILSYWD